MEFTDSSNTRQGKTGNVVGQSFDQIRRKGLSQQVFQVSAIDG
jgi:hypothetical protein